MKISELITILQQTLEQTGDLTIAIDNEGLYEWYGSQGVTKETFKVDWRYDQNLFLINFGETVALN